MVGDRKLQKIKSIEGARVQSAIARPWDASLSSVYFNPLDSSARSVHLGVSVGVQGLARALLLLH
jgi:hypothetical protein